MTQQKFSRTNFYTELRDIEDELQYYGNHFEAKTVLCNCDDPYESNFFKFFALQFHILGLKKLIASCYDARMIELEDFNDDGATDLLGVERLLKNKKDSNLIDSRTR